ncbi:Sua5/YciO/YrdC/YwlC family protein [gut metagenome]|uniref:L-threonylcarbamoyladenylate synthase n=1 Tax=gut metagenome TaxID=749906 RepID=J9FJ79_9ZZZZ
MADILNYDNSKAKDIGLRLKSGQVGIFPCDTIYGICASATDENAERIYQIKRRPQSKSFITLMTKEQLMQSDLIVPEDLISLWPAPFTAILANKEVLQLL